MTSAAICDRVSIFRANVACDRDNLPNSIHVREVVLGGRDVLEYSIFNKSTNTYQASTTHEATKAINILHQYNQVGAHGAPDDGRCGLLKTAALLVGYLAVWSWFCYDVIGGDVVLPIIKMFGG